MASLYNSPPDNLVMSRSKRWPNSSASISFAELPFVSFFFIISPTIPLTCLGIASTYCTFIADLKNIVSFGMMISNQLLELLLEHLSEIPLQFGTSEVLQQLIPIWRIIESTKIRHLLPCKNLESSRLSNTICTNESEHLNKNWSINPRYMRRYLYTYPARGVGNLWSLKVLGPYLCTRSNDISLGRLMILMAWSGHFLTHMLQPMQSDSWIELILS